MLKQCRKSIKQFWRKIVIDVTVLVLLIQPGTIEQLMAQQHNKKQRLGLIEARARAMRTYVDPMLPVGRQQEILCRRQLKSSRGALAEIKAGKDAKSLIKDMEALQKKLKTTHLKLQVELMGMRVRLVENDISQEILDRHDEFCQAVQKRYRRFDRLLTIAQKNQADSDRLQASLEELVEFLQPSSKARPVRNSSERSKPHLPRHSAAFSARRPAGPPFFQWPWLIAAAGDVIGTILTQMGQIESASGRPDANDLAHDTPEINFDPNDSTDPIVAKAAELGHNPVKIFEYVRNELAYEPYFGSVKGAKRTLEEEAGNDMDLASTLMALLRASDIPCRYVFGTIELSVEEAAGWTGVSNPGQVVELFQANGVPLEVDYAGGVAETIRIDHIWVKAYVDNFPYRGAVRENNYDGDSDGDVWIDLDASFKQHTFTGNRGIENSVGVDIDPDTLLTNALVDATVVEDGDEEYVFGINEDLIGEQLLLLAEPIRDYLAARGLTTETVFRQRQVSEERYGILPVTDQYKIHARGCNFSSLPDELRYQFTVTLRNPDNTVAFSVTRSLPELAGKKITLLYEPANENYAEILTDPNIIDDPNFFPVYLMSLKSQLRIDSQVIAEAENDSEMVGMGRWQALEMTFTAPDGTTELITHPIRAGGIHSLVLDPQRITGGDLDQHYTAMDGLIQQFDANEPLMPDETVGDILYGIGLSYFHQMDRFNQITAGSLGVAITRHPSVVNVAWDISITDTFIDPDLPYSAASDRVRITIGRDVYVPVAIDGRETNTFIPEDQFLFSSALTSSALEHNVLMQALPGTQAASVARVIKTANGKKDPNNPIYTITTLQQAESLTADGNSLANLPDYVKEDIKDAANAGYEITIPKSAVQIDGIADCNYVGYIKRNIVTNASDFILYDAALDKVVSGELKDNSLTPAQLLGVSEPSSDPNGYAALKDVVASTAAWMKVAEDATTNAGLSYLPAIVDIGRWFQSRTYLDPVTTVASVLAVTNPISRLSVQSGILNVEAGAGSNGKITQSGWVGISANEFIIHADVTRNAQWQANIYRHGESTPHLAQVDGNEPNMVAVFTFAEPNDGYYRYVLTAGSGETEAVSVEDAFHVDLTEPNAVITDVNPPDPNILGLLVVRGTARDDYFVSYQVSVSQYGNEPNVVYTSTTPVDNDILCEISTVDYNDTADVNIILEVMDLAGNTSEVIVSATISNPDISAPDVNLSAVWDSNEIGPDSLVDGKIDISVTPVDPNEKIKRIELWWCDQDGRDCQLVVVEEDPNGSPLDVNSANPWTYELNTYLFENGPSTLTVYAGDMFGNMDTNSVSFFNNSTISNFKVEPSIATPLHPEIEVSASLKESALWTITIYDPCNNPVDSNTATSALILEGYDVSDWNDGTYLAQLSVGAYDANVSFVVALDSPIAEISNLNDIYKEGLKDLGLDPLPIVSEGLFRLEGAAYHPSFEGDVEYRLELFKPQAAEYYPPWDAFKTDPDRPWFVKNITPGDLQEGFCEGRVEPYGSLGTLDLTGVENGTYQLLLTVRYAGSESYANVGFVLDCPLKLGNVRFTQEDLVVPVAGMPLRVTRTYDSLNKDVDGDFGYGWSYSIADMDVELDESREVLSESYGGPSESIRVGNNYARNVTLTLPDGQRATFLFYLEKSGFYYVAEYQSPPGVNAALRTKQVERLGFGGMWDGQGIYTGGAIELPENYDFSGYILTTEDGTRYHIKRQAGTEGFYDYGGYPVYVKPYGEPYLSYITTPSGETIDFNAGFNGNRDLIIGDIEHYERNSTEPTKTVKIEYEDNHIVAIRAPSEQNTGDPNTIKYEYDGAGNLIKVYKLVDKAVEEYETTEYVYDNPTDHYITDINDPRGLKPIRYEYDNNGRLTATIDAKGDRIEISHADVDGKKAETIYDRFGYATTYFYNDRGNVTAVTNAIGYTIAYEYGDSSNPDKATAITDPLGNTTYYQYDSSGRTTRVDDPESNVTTYRYGYNGNLIETVQYIPNPENTNELIEISRTANQYDVVYPSRNLLEKTTDALGNSTVYDYDSNNRLLTVTQQVSDPNTGDVVDVVTTNVYNETLSNSSHQPYSTTDPAGFTRYFAYDENGNQTESWYNWVDANDSNNTCTVTTITEYDAADRAVKTIRDVNNVAGNVVASTVTLSQTQYNKIGRPDIVINGFGVLTKYEYDELGNLVETKVYDSSTAFDSNDILTISRMLYDKQGRVVVTVGSHDPCEAVNGTEAVYDPLGRVVETRRWADVNIPVEDITVGDEVLGRRSTGWSHGVLLSVTRTKYDIAGRVVKTIVQDENGYEQVTSYEYDNAGRQTAVIDANSNRTEYEYEANRRVLARDTLGRETRFTYDTLSRLVQTIYHNGTFTYVDYDQLGRRTAQTDQAGRTRWFEYDSAGRLIAVILPDVNDPDNGNTPTYPRYEYKYDKYGILTAVWDNVEEDPNTGQIDYSFRRETKFTYNELHRQTSKTLPNGKSEYRIYDANGLLIKSTDFKGQVVGFEYSSRGLLEYQRFYDSNSLYPADPNMIIHINYDNLSRKDTVDVNDLDADTLATYGYHYDAEGRVYQLDSPQGFVRYEFSDITGRRLSVRTPAVNANTQISYTYDELGRLAGVQVDKRNGITPTDETIYYSYNAVGSLESVTYPNGNYATYTYDNLNRLTNLVHKNSSQTTLASYEYTLAADGRRIAVTETDNYANTTTINWTYDALNRLLVEDYNAPDSENDFKHEYVYNLVGNRLSKTAVSNTTTYIYNSNDQLTQETTADANIFYSYDLNGSLVEDANDVSTVRTYTYNLRGRLAKVEVESGSTVDYIYNPDGIRVRATVNGSDTDYLIDPYNHTGYAQVFKADVAGDPNTAYILGHDVLGQAKGIICRYFLYDGHGSVRQLATRATGAVIANYAYDAYGNAHGFDPANAATKTKLLYAGEMYDQYTQQYYLRARWYSPATGRFNRIDPFAGNNFDPQSLHKYTYVHNNPINGIDPTGLFTQRFGYLAEAAIQGIYALDHPGDSVLYGKWTRLPGVGYNLKPDIFNLTKCTWLEIKPLSVSGIAHASARFALYGVALGFHGYLPEVTWKPSTHFVLAGTVNIFFFNAGGIVFYTDVFDNAEDLLALSSIAAVRNFIYSPLGRHFIRGAIGSLSRIPGLVNARIGIDKSRLQGHLSISSLFGALGVL